MIKVGSDCSGIGAFIQALKALGIEYTEEFACDFDYYARISYLANYGTVEDLKLARTKQHKKYADGVKKIALSEEEPTVDDIRFLNEANEFAKSFSFYFPFNMYQRDIPKDPLDIYVSTVPRQAFSIAGKRKGEGDKRGILFYNSHEFIQKNKPRYFLFENVKGLLSHDKDSNDPKNPIGRTFNKWIQLLGGKSIDGNQVLFPHDDAVPYHIYIKVLNATDFGVPQNRERVFIVGIRDDVNNRFEWPSPITLEKQLIDILEDEVDEKYFLTKKAVQYLFKGQKERGRNRFNISDGEGISTAITSNYSKGVHNQGETYISHPVCVRWQNKDSGVVIDSKAPSLRSSGGTDIRKKPCVLVKSANSKGFEEATEYDSINFSHPNSKTRRGRVGKKVAQTLDASCNQGICIPVNSPDIKNKDQNGRRFKTNGEVSFTLTSQDRHGVLISNDSGQSFKIRRFTPRECLRLMGFPDYFKIAVSDTQIYRQSGNSIVMDVLSAIINNLKLI
ncbi:DNA (cytosine-5-)-methyltransferase [Muricauda sp. MAR_2010_75]|uniref:DNA (cytosine-5-)-methyltransferase n=1 Tax=Allomuricauda sp. MAR_2010_75 TaxID=1250232 RepID=UPI00056CB3CD|nr:DNA (cytosine-5-)-methyltransferase [Muricauda sp. MAR_2010_75]